LKISNILLLIAVLAVAAAVYFVTRPADEESSTDIEPRVRLWEFDMNELAHITVELPRLEMSESFVKHEDRQWYFDNPSGAQVDPDRWGGGIPFNLSGPYTDRKIKEDATKEQLEDYGFTPPEIKLTLTKEDGEVVNIELGDAVPDGSAYYIRLAGSNDIYTIVESWQYVVERLVLEPPYPTEEEE
jgi:hypothetical protein